MGEAASAGNTPFTINQVGSMVSIFFTGGPVTDFGSAAASDTGAFKEFFWHMLSRGSTWPQASTRPALSPQPTLRRTFRGPSRQHTSGSTGGLGGGAGRPHA